MDYLLIMAVTRLFFKLGKNTYLKKFGQGIWWSPNDLNIHIIRAKTGLRLKGVKRMLYALNHQVFDKPVRCLMSLKSVMSFLATMSVDCRH